ncbi:MAG: rhodanese-like domain-containing protein [Nitrospinota bacterium]|nr:rhodanese-like domain-containing protein [Nitrospinota bacterium]
MRGYKNPDLLWAPDRLRRTLDAGPPLILDIRTTQDYVAGHIPGAVHLDLFGLSVRHTGPESLDSFFWMIEGLFGNRGVDHGKTVVVHDDRPAVRATKQCRQYGRRPGSSGPPHHQSPTPGARPAR